MDCLPQCNHNVSQKCKSKIVFYQSNMWLWKKAQRDDTSLALMEGRCNKPQLNLISSTCWLLFSQPGRKLKVYFWMKVKLEYKHTWGWRYCSEKWGYIETFPEPTLLSEHGRSGTYPAYPTRRDSYLGNVTDLKEEA